MKLLKRLLLGLFVLILIAVAGIAYVVATFNPNDYKQDIVKAAADNGVNLAINGNLGWQFFPTLAVNAGETRVSGTTQNPSIPDVSFKEANFSLDWQALINKKIRLEAIAIDGADITLASSEEAATAAAPVAAAAQKSPTSPSNKSSGKLPFEVAIDTLSLTNSRITLVKKDAPNQVLKDVNIIINGLNLDQRPFDLDAKLHTSLPDLAEDLAVAVTSKVTFQQEPLLVNLANTTLSAIGIPKLPVKLSLNSVFDGKADSLKVKDLKGTIGSANLSGSITGKQVTNSPLMSGKISLQNLLLAELPMDPPEGFKKVGFSSQFTASDKSIVLKGLKLAVDSFNATGKLSMTLPAPRTLNMVINGGDFVVPPSTPQTEDSSQPAAAILTPLLAPLAALEGGKGDVKITLNSVTADKIRVDKLRLNVGVKGKVINISELSGNVFDGKFNTTANVDLRNKVPSVRFTEKVTGINLYNVLSTMADQQDVKGHFDMNFSGSSKGDSSDALMAAMQGTGNYNFSDMQIANINVEKSYCEMLSLVENKAVLQGKEWPNYTQLNNMKGPIQWKNSIITLPGFTTGLSNIAVAGNGEVDISKESYNMLVSMTLNGGKTSENGCKLTSKLLMGRKVPFRCEGTYGVNGKASCLPDKSFIKGLVAGKAKELLDKNKDKILDKLFKKSKDAAEGEEDPKRKAVEGLLKGLF